MTEQEVDAVAAELARASGISWPPGPASGPQKMVLERYKDRARLAIAAVERVRAQDQAVAAGHRRIENVPIRRAGWVQARFGCCALGRWPSFVLPARGPESSSLSHHEGRGRPRLPCPGTA